MIFLLNYNFAGTRLIVKVAVKFESYYNFYKKGEKVVGQDI